MNDATMIQSSEGSVSGEMQYLEPPPAYESRPGTDQDNSNEPVYSGTPPLPPYYMESNVESEPVVWDDQRNLVADSSSQPIRCTENRKRGILIACIAAIIIVVLVIVTVYLTKDTSCPGPDPLENGVMSYHRRVVHYRCNKGYSLKGSATMYCNDAGLWSGSAPFCDMAFCDDPEQISNGDQDTLSKTDGSFRYGDDVHYSCYIGYKISGTRHRTCLSSGQWSGNLPVCTVVSCGRPAAPDNGSVRGTLFTYGQSVFYSCNPGYQLFGNKRRTCTDSGNWNGTTPVCTVST